MSKRQKIINKNTSVPILVTPADHAEGKYNKRKSIDSIMDECNFSKRLLHYQIKGQIELMKLEILFQK